MFRTLVAFTIVLASFTQANALVLTNTPANNFGYIRRHYPVSDL